MKIIAKNLSVVSLLALSAFAFASCAAKSGCCGSSSCSVKKVVKESSSSCSKASCGVKH